MPPNSLYDRESRKSLRPWFLVAALLLTWLVGMHGMRTGCQTAAYLKNGAIPDTSEAVEDAREADNPARAFDLLSASAEAGALAETRERTLPLAVARLLLSTLLVAATALALVGRRGAPRLLGQALIAMIAFAVIEYALTKDTRAIYLRTLATSAAELGAGQAQGFVIKARLLLSMKLVLIDVGAMVLTGMALLSRRSRTFFDVTARAAEQRVDEEDDL